MYLTRASGEMKNIGNTDCKYMMNNKYKSVGLTSKMLLNLSAKLGSFKAVTSLMAPLTDFSRDRSLTSSVARTSLSPETKTMAM